MWQHTDKIPLLGLGTFSSCILCVGESNGLDMIKCEADIERYRSG